MKNRNAAIDGYRGLMLFIMTLGHLSFLPFISLKAVNTFVSFNAFTGMGWLSVVEGFCFLSGLVAGINYKKSSGAFKRAAKLYFTQIVLLFAFALAFATSQWYYDCFDKLHSIVYIWIDAPGIHYFMDHPFIGAVLGSLFIYFPPYFDILPLFMCFTLLAPLVVSQLEKGRGNWVFGLSALIWLLVQFAPPALLLERVFSGVPHDFGWFSPWGFQLVFVLGVMIGHALSRGDRTLLWEWCVKFGLFLALALPILWFSGDSLDTIDRLGWLRIVGFSLKAILAFGIAQFVVLRPFVLLGRWSLHVFTYHIVLILGMTALFEQIGTLAPWLSYVAFAASLSTLWIFAASLERLKIRSTEHKKIFA